MRFWYLFISALVFAPVAQASGIRMETSWYESGERTADGTRFNPENPTIAASRTLPLHTIIFVTNPENGRKLTMVVHDRGPFKVGRALDVSRSAARKLGFLREGVALLIVRVKVRIEPS